MRANLEFDLPNDDYELQLALRGQELADALSKIRALAKAAGALELAETILHETEHLSDLTDE